MIGKAIPNLPSRDLDATAAMFARLGFAETGRWDGYSILVRGDIELHYYAKDDLDPGSTAGMCYLRISRVDDFYAEVLAAGFEILDGAALDEQWASGGSLARISTLEDKPWGLRQFALLDVDNNLLQVGELLADIDRRRLEKVIVPDEDAGVPEIGDWGPDEDWSDWSDAVD